MGGETASAAELLFAAVAELPECCPLVLPAVHIGSPSEMESVVGAHSKELNKLRGCTTDRVGLDTMS
jgi:hypothetical protein